MDGRLDWLQSLEWCPIYAIFLNIEYSYRDSQYASASSNMLHNRQLSVELHSLNGPAKLACVLFVGSSDTWPEMSTFPQQHHPQSGFVYHIPRVFSWGRSTNMLCGGVTLQQPRNCGLEIENTCTPSQLNSCYASTTALNWQFGSLTIERLRVRYSREIDIASRYCLTFCSQLPSSVWSRANFLTENQQCCSCPCTSFTCMSVIQGTCSKLESHTF